MHPETRTQYGRLKARYSLSEVLPVSPKTEKVMKFALSLMVVLVALAVAHPAMAQGGGVDTCKNSPENPTAILALVGSAGGALVAVRTRLRRK
jgi:XrtJ-associated TM-motif-TM protein